MDVHVLQVVVEDNCPVVVLSDGSRYPVVDMVWSRPAVECHGSDPNCRYFEPSNEITVSITYTPTVQ